MQAEGFHWDGIGSHTSTWLNITLNLLPDTMRHLGNSFAVTLGTILYVTLFFSGPTLNCRSRLVITSALVIGIYLCFAPYLSTYDQLLIVIPLLASASRGCFESFRMVLSTIILLLFTLIASTPSIFAWIAKLLLLGGVAAYAYVSERLGSPRKTG